MLSQNDNHKYYGQIIWGLLCIHLIPQKTICWSEDRCRKPRWTWWYNLGFINCSKLDTFPLPKHWGFWRMEMEEWNSFMRTAANATAKTSSLNRQLGGFTPDWKLKSFSSGPLHLFYNLIRHLLLSLLHKSLRLLFLHITSLQGYAHAFSFFLFSFCSFYLDTRFLHVESPIFLHPSLLIFFVKERKKTCRQRMTWMVKGLDSKMASLIIILHGILRVL